MATLGLTDTGFVPALIPDIRDGIEADLRTTFYRSLPLGDQTLLGHLVGIIAEQTGLLWELGEANYSAIDPDQATGTALDVICALTGTLRQQPTSSVAVETCCGNDGTVVAGGSGVATASTSQLFTSENSAVISLLDSWVAATPYAVGDRVTNATQCFQCTIAGTSAGSGGPSITAFGTQTDNTVTWAWIGQGTAAVDVTMTSSNTGPITAVAGDLSAIQSPTFGWNTAVNLLDAVEGLALQSDQSLRLTREAELQGAGGTTADALRAALLKLSGVISATIFVNITDTTDGNGLPPHSFETLVLGGDAQDIVNTIAANLPMGIATYGGMSGTYTDSEGNVDTIYYSVPADILIFIAAYVNYVAVNYPSDGDTEVQTAILTWGSTFITDEDVDPSAVGAQAFQVPGVKGVPQVLVYNDVIGTPVAWAGTTSYSSTVGSRSVVTNDGGRCYICVTGGTSAGSGGPTGVGTAITDGSVTWYFLGNVYNISTRQLAVFDSTRTSIRSTAVSP